MPEPTDEYVIVTDGDLVHRISDLLGAVSDEHRFHITDDGLSVTSVNPGNTIMVDLSVSSTGFDGFNTDGTTVGVELDEFDKRIQSARKGRGGHPLDHVVIKGHGDYCSIKVDRDDDFEHTSGFHTVDPDSIRKEPTIPDLDLPWTASGLDARSFAEAAGRAEDIHNHTAVGVDPRERKNGETIDDREQGDFYIYGRTKDEGEVTSDDEFRFRWACEADADTDPMESVVDSSYLKGFTTALKDAHIDSVDVRFSQEFPIMLDFHDADYGITGSYMAAPRISDEGGDIGHWHNPTWEDDQ